MESISSVPVSARMWWLVSLVRFWCAWAKAGLVQGGVRVVWHRVAVGVVGVAGPFRRCVRLGRWRRSGAGLL